MLRYVHLEPLSATRSGYKSGYMGVRKMWTIILTLCSLAAHNECIERRLSFVDEKPMTPFVCMALQSEIAKLMEGYPDRFVSKWQCFAGKKEDT